jgi:hypothetical protein
MGPYGEYGRPIAIFEAWQEWAALQEADSKADFPSFLFGPVRQALWQGYSRVEPQWDRYARVENAPDFRERRLCGASGTSATTASTRRCGARSARPLRS